LRQDRPSPGASARAAIFRWPKASGHLVMRR
jgi:hypothetical protein